MIHGDVFPGLLYFIFLQPMFTLTRLALVAIESVSAVRSRAPGDFRLFARGEIET